MMSDPIKSSVHIVPVGENKVNITYSTRVLFKKEGNLFSCFMPSMDMTFTANSQDEIQNVASSLIKGYMDYWLHNYGIGRFSVELKAQGFKAEKDAVVMFALRNNKKVKADFDNVINIKDPSYDQNLNISVDSAA